MMYRFETNLSPQEFNDFVSQQTTTPLLQSYEWSFIKDTFKPLYTGVKENGVLVATALVLIRSLPLNQKLAYIPRGPILDINNQELLTFFSTQLKKLAKDQGCFLLRIDPAIDYKCYVIEEQDSAQPNSSATRAITNLVSVGYLHRGLPFDFSDSFQPRLEAIIEIDDNTQNRYQKRLTKALKYSQKRLTEIQHGRHEYLDDLANMILLTEERQQVHLRNRDYFKLLLDNYPNTSFITKAVIKPKQFIQIFNQRIQSRQDEIEKIKDKSPKKVFHLNEQIASLQSLIKELDEVKDHDEITIGALLWVVYGNSMNLLYAGTDIQFTKFYPQEMIYDALVEKATQMNLKAINMGGVEGSLDDGLTIFKAQFSPIIHEYIGEFDLPLSFKYNLFNIAWKIRKQLKSIKKKIKPYVT